jgi:hypothetical protein
VEEEEEEEEEEYCTFKPLPQQVIKYFQSSPI